MTREVQASSSTLTRDLIDTGLTVVDACILCRCAEVERDTKWEGWLSLQQPYGVMRCVQCGLRWLSPRPDSRGLEVIYSDRHYFRSGGVTDYLQYAEQRISHFQGRISRLKAMGVHSILDYGAATGEFVHLASASGLDVVGIELSEAARVHALTTHDVSLLTPEQGDALDRSFDAIHMNHVLEHMPNPLDHIRWCFDRMRPGGTLVIEVPRQFENDADRLRRAIRRGGKNARFDAFSLHHTYFFTPGTLHKLIETVGLKVTSLCTPLAPNPHVSSGRRRALDALLAWSARSLMRGDVIEAYAVKPSEVRS